MVRYPNPRIPQSAPRRAARSSRRLIGRLAAPVVVLGSALGLMVAPSAAGAATTSNLPVPSSNQLVSMFASPATLVVAERTQFAFKVFAPVLNVDRLISFAGTDPATVAAESAGDFTSASADILAELESHPGAYLSNGKATVVGYDSISQGTGFAVTSNGYVVTNHHVVDFSEADARSELATDTDGSPTSTSVHAANQIEAQAQEIAWGTTPLSISTADADALTQLATSWVQVRSAEDGFDQSISVGGGQSVHALSVRSKTNGMKATLVKASAGEWPSADVAILKVHAKNLPVIPLGDDSTLQVGDTVHAVGYPADASFEADVNSAPSQTVTATVTSGQVTNRIPEHGGFSAIEDTAVTNHGNSGGPLLDAAGRAIGIVTAGTQDTGGAFFYAEPISVVETYLRAAGVPFSHQPVSADQVTFDQAMELMQQSHYKAAMNDLMAVQADGFNTPYVMMHTQMVQQAINHGDDVPVGGFPTPLWVLVALVALVALAVGGAGVLRHRHQAARVLTVAPSGQTITEASPEVTVQSMEGTEPRATEPEATEPDPTEPEPEPVLVPEAPAVPEAPKDAKELVVQLRQLMELKVSGIITERDFEQKKDDILARI